MEILWPMIGYLLGSLPSGVIVARLMGLADPRSGGSGNIGATNVLRTGGAVAAILTLAGDTAKGVIPVLAAREFLASPSPWIYATAGAAVIGHDFSMFLRFRGGKGVATTLGVLAALSPIVAILSATLWAVVVAQTRYVSVGSITAALLGPGIAWVVSREAGLTVFCAGAGLLLVALHHGNIRRLRDGTEKKLSFGTSSKAG